MRKKGCVELKVVVQQSIKWPRVNLNALQPNSVELSLVVRLKYVWRFSHGTIAFQRMSSDS